MSLEDQIKALTEAVVTLGTKLDKNSQVTEQLSSVREEVIEAVNKAVTDKKGASAKATADKKPAESKPAATPETKDEPASVDPAIAAKYETAKTLMATYTTGSSREGEVAARKNKVIFLLRHPTLAKPEVVEAYKSLKAQNPAEALSDAADDGAKAIAEYNSNTKCGPFSVEDVKDESLDQLIKNLKAAIDKGDLTAAPVSDIL